MPTELKVPEVGESISEVQIGRWLKKPGDSVEKDETLVEIETDKVTLELPAPASGRMGEITHAQGAHASVGDVIGFIEDGEGSEAGGAETSSTVQATADQKHNAADSEPKPKPNTNASNTKTSNTKDKSPSPSPTGPEATPADRGQHARPAQQRDSEQYVEKDRPPSEGGDGHDGHDGRDTAAAPERIMPSAARLMAREGVEAGDIQPTGPGGRILKEDVQQALQARTAAPAPAPTATAREEEAVPMSPLRRRIAQRLVQAQQTGALLTTYNEVDMSAVMNLRTQHKEAFEKRHGVKLGFMSFFVKAAVDALKQHPAVNAEVRDTDIIYKNYFDIGIAVGTGKGLVVPVLRNADRLSFAQVEATIGDFAKRANANQLKLDELQGGTFTITNGGVFGSLLSTPIVNPPQSAILGMHAIQPRPIALNNEVVIRPMMYLALTYDHRLVDGREAVTFLVRIKQTIEDPARMLMEV